MTNSHIKQSPFVGYAGFGGGVGALSAKSSASKTYVDDVFSTYLYEGTGGNIDVDNGIDVSTEGGLVWIKRRDGYSNFLFDTARGGTEALITNGGNAEFTEANGVHTFNTDGFSIGAGSDGAFNGSGIDYTSWTFRKSKGFFDIVTWTGDGSNPRNISHNLESIPGCICYKRTDAAADWYVYHSSMPTNPANYLLQLDATIIAYGSHGDFGSTLPTAEVFTVAGNLNVSGQTYIAYIFAGGDNGESSVEFDGTGDYLNLAANTGFDFGTGAYTVECWVKTTATNGWLFFNATNDTGLRLCIGNNGGTGSNNGKIEINEQVSNSDTYTQGSTAVNDGDWHHIAISRDSGSNTLIYVDGTLDATGTSGKNLSGSNPVFIGSRSASAHMSDLEGKISNMRVVKGQGLYTSNFTPSTTPLTPQSQSVTQSNVTLICCNGPAAGSSTASPVEITEHGNVSRSTDNPFGTNGAEEYIFGGDSDKNIIQCGSYLGNASSTGPVLNLGWEPQWIMIKKATGSTTSADWYILDSMRGIVSGDDDAILEANTADGESSNGWNLGKLTSSGFQLEQGGASVNGDHNQYVYIAIRRPDGYVGKPATSGTEVFAQAYGADSGDFRFTSNFPVDFAWAKLFAGSGNWWTSARLIQKRELKTNNTDAGASGTNKVFDSMTKWHSSGADSTYISHMFKRHKGFDVVTYNGNGTNQDVRHNLSQAPEMMWIKARTGTYASSQEWAVYHKGLNGGTNPQDRMIYLNTDGAEGSQAFWNGIAPTSAVFTVGMGGDVGNINMSSYTYIAMLFSSVTGISKVGYYTGNGTSQSISLGFQPRFLILKNASSTEKWYVLDTVRGWASGTDTYLSLNTDYAQASASTFGEPTSTGFDISGSDAWQNANGDTFIYYAHA